MFKYTRIEIDSFPDGFLVRFVHDLTTGEGITVPYQKKFSTLEEALKAVAEVAQVNI